MTVQNMKNRSTKMSNPITARQREILMGIIDLTDERGYPPTFREIGKKFGITDKGVFDHLNSLQRKGFITRVVRLSRSIRLTDKIGIAIEKNGTREYYLKENIESNPLSG